MRKAQNDTSILSLRGAEGDEEIPEIGTHFSGIRNNKK